MGWDGGSCGKAAGVGSVHSPAARRHHPQMRHPWPRQPTLVYAITLISSGPMPASSRACWTSLTAHSCSQKQRRAMLAVCWLPWRWLPEQQLCGKQQAGSSSPQLFRSAGAEPFSGCRWHCCGSRGVLQSRVGVN